MCSNLSNSSPGLTSSISELIETSISGNESDDIATMKDIDTLMDRVISESTAEAEKCTLNNDFEGQARSYFLLAKALNEAAKLIKDKKVSEVLLRNSTSWSSYADNVLASSSAGLMQEAYEQQKLGDYDRYIDYKTKAKLLEYELRTGIIKSRLEHQAAEFVKHRIEDFRTGSRLQIESTELDRIIDDYRSKYDTSKDASAPSSDEISPILKEVADQITIRNIFRPSPKGNELYDWTVFLHNDNDDLLERLLRKVQTVTYTLHETFPKPVIELGSDRSSDHFKLEATGWGEFEIKVDIMLTSGETITKYHWLKLH